MLSAAYDILRKDAAALIWVEAVHDLETAKLRVKELAAISQDEYVIFDQRTGKITANGASPSACASEHASEHSPAIRKV